MHSTMYVLTSAYTINTDKIMVLLIIDCRNNYYCHNCNSLFSIIRVGVREPSPPPPPTKRKRDVEKRKRKQERDEKDRELRVVGEGECAFLCCSASDQ